MEKINSGSYQNNQKVQKKNKKGRKQHNSNQAKRRILKKFFLQSINLSLDGGNFSNNNLEKVNEASTLKAALCGGSGNFSGHGSVAMKTEKVIPSGVTVVIDLSFDSYMKNKHIKLCALQILKAYTSNKKAMRPFPLHFTGLKKGSEMFAAMNRHNGRQNWGIWHEESYLDFFDKTKLIYLTSESENVLDTLKPGAVYVIGGLVDFNRHKNLCNRIALENGIRTARLPLSENVVMKNSPVLPIDQCFDIILGVSQGKTWQKSIMDVLSYRRLLAPTNNVQTPESSKNEQSGIVDGPIKLENDMEKAYENEQSGIVDDPIKSKSDMEYASDKLRFEEARKKLNQAVKMDSSEMFN